MGKRRADWAKIGNVAVLGLGAVSTAVGGARALQNNFPKLRNRATEMAGKGSEGKSQSGEAPEKSETEKTETEQSGS